MEEATAALQSLLRNFKSTEEILEFIEKFNEISEERMEELQDELDGDSDRQFFMARNKVRSKLGAQDIGGIFLDESLREPDDNKEFPESKKHLLKSVDSFLYDDEELEELEEQGLLCRHYCEKCQSSDSIVPLDFISHSMSRREVKILFRDVLTAVDVDLCGKVIVDIGSRLGAVLYGAYLYTSARSIVGIEQSANFSRIQREVVSDLGWNDRISIVEDDVLNQLSVLQSSDLIIMHNVFEFFSSKDSMQFTWAKLRETISLPGQFLLSCPPLEDLFDRAGLDLTGADWEGWLHRLQLPDEAHDHQFALYRVM